MPGWITRSCPKFRFLVAATAAALLVFGTEQLFGPSAYAQTVGSPATLTLAPNTATNPVNTQHCVTATVGDASSVPVPGVTVHFAVTGSVNTTGAAATGANGQAGFCYAGPSVAGTDSISAFADANGNGTQEPDEPGSTATKTWVAPAAVTLAPSAGSKPVNTQHCVTATVADASGTATPGVTVRFAVSGSVTAAGSAATGANGQAGFCYAGPSVAGTDTISAFADTNGSGVQDAGEPGNTATNTWTPPAALTLAPNAAINAVNTQHCVTATVADASGTATPGVTARFTVSGSVTAAGSATTSANGQAGFCYAGPSMAGTDTISAFADTNGSGVQDASEPGNTATKAWAVPAALTLAPSAATGPVSTQHCVNATVTDTSGTAIPGVTVRFAVSGSVAAAGSATTGGSGQARFCYAGPSVAGTDSISAFADTNVNGTQDAGEPGNTAAKTWAVPEALTLAPSAGSRPVNTRHCVTATVADASGTAIPGVTVRFAVSGAVTAAGSSATGANGQAEFCYAGPSVGGTDSISAFADTNGSGAQDAGEPGNTATNTWNPPAAVTLAPSADSRPVNTRHCVTATVADASGTATPGVMVRFTVSGAVTAAGSAATSVSGQAGFCYAGPSVGGTDTISAFADTNGSGAREPDEPGGTATNTWNPPAALTLAPNAATNPVNTQHCVNATVADASGTATPGVTVRFTVSGSVTAGGSVTTGGNGQAGYCYAGPSVAGSDTVSAFADTNGSGAQDAGEPGSTATTTWAVIAMAPPDCGPIPVKVNEQTNRIYVADSCRDAVSVIDGTTNAVAATVTVGRGSSVVALSEATNRIYVANSNGALSVIDGATNSVVATAAVGPAPTALAINETTDRIYVANFDGTVAVIDGATNAVAAVVAVGHKPIAVEVNEDTNRIYVVNSHGIVSVIDGTTNSVTATVTAAPGPTAMEIHGATNRIYVAHSNGTVSVIGGETSSVVATVTVGPGPTAVGINAQTNRVYVASHAAGSGSTVSVIDGATNSVAATVTVGPGPMAVAINEPTNRIYVAHSNGSVSVMDGATDAVVTTMAVGQGPIALGISEPTNRIYVANACGTVSVIDGASHTVVATVTVGAGPIALGINETANRLYAAYSCGNTVSVIDGASSSVVATATVGARPIAVGINETTNRSYVVNGDGTVSVINGTTSSVVATVTVGPEPVAVELNQATNRIYVVNSNDTVSVINGATNTVVAAVPVGRGPTATGINEATNRLYVANSNGTVSVINGATNTVVATVAVGPGPIAAEVNEATNRIYVANYGAGSGNTVSVINGSTNSVLATVRVGQGPIAAKIIEETNRIYVANVDGTVSVIAGATSSVIATVRVGQGPVDVGINALTNRIYVANTDGTVSVIDGATNSVVATVAVGQKPVAVEINQETDRIYVANFNGAVSVIDGATNSVVATVTVGPGQ